MSETPYLRERAIHYRSAAESCNEKDKFDLLMIAKDFDDEADRAEARERKVA